MAQRVFRVPEDIRCVIYGRLSTYRPWQVRLCLEDAAVFYPRPPLNITRDPRVNTLDPIHVLFL